MCPADDDLPPTAGTPTGSPPAPAPAAEGQRCRLSVLFCDLTGSTELSADLEAEDYAELLGALRQLYASTVSAHGGTLVRIQGDGMLAIFGWPQSREGDSRRAVEAAVQLHAQVAALRGFGPAGHSTPLRLHSGVHAGLVLVQRGDTMTGSLDLLGRAPNIAARLSDAAESDEILVSDDSLGPDLHHFDTGAPRGVPVDHRGTQVLARPVLGRGREISSFEARTRRRLQPFIGRQTEQRLLDHVLGQTLAGATLRLAIAAAPGVGKSRLAREFLAGAERKGCRVLQGQGLEDGAHAPLQPLAQMLRGLLHVTAEVAPALARAALGDALAGLGRSDLVAALAPLLGLPGSSVRPAEQAQAVLAALGLLFEALAERQPLVLFIDDWHWADAATRQLLSTVGRDQPGLPLLVLATTRGITLPEAELHGLQVLDLVPFSQAETTDSVRHLMPRADPFIAAEICLYSGGNPLYVEELCHSAAHDGPEGWQARRLDSGNWLNVLVQSRVARLPAEQAELVRLAAVVGTIIPPGLLQHLSGRNSDDPVWAALADKDLLYADDDGFRFKHGLTRDVIYEAVGLQARRSLHQCVAQALLALAAPQAGEADAPHDLPHEALAYHLRGAGQPQAAAQHAEAAADRAAAVALLDRARTMYHLALSELETAGVQQPAQAERWLAISTRLALVSVFDGARADLPVFERGVQRARALDQPALVAHAEHSLGYVLYALGESAACITHIEKAMRAAGSGNDPLAVQIRATLGMAKAAAADYTGAQPLLLEAVEIKRSHRNNPARGVGPGAGRGSKRNAVNLAYSLVCLASVLGDRGEFDSAHALLDEAWSVVDGHGHPIGASIQGWRSALLTWQGRWVEARQVAQESAWIAERTRSLFQFCQGRATAAYADWKLTDDPRFIEVADQATGWLDPRDSGLFRSLNHGWLVDGWLACGQHDKARRHAALAVQRGRRGDLIGAAMACRALALDAARRGQSQRAARWLARAEQVAARRQSAHESACNQLCAAQLARLQSRSSSALALADTAQQAFAQLQMPWFAEQARHLVQAIPPAG